MADLDLSSDPEQTHSPSSVQEQTQKQPKKALRKTRHIQPWAQDRTELRCHKALEKQFEKARRAPRTTACPEPSLDTGHSPRHERAAVSPGPQFQALDSSHRHVTASALSASRVASMSLPDLSLAPQLERLLSNR